MESMDFYDNQFDISLAFHVTIPETFPLYIL
jgi:hypothetical protein